jgi:two-component system phosphate regulon sensor histidine kinase PhoR
LEDVEDIKSEEGKEILDSLVESVTNLNRTITDLTDKSDGLDSKNPEKGLGKVHLQQIVNEVRLSLKDKISKSNTEIKTDFNIPDIKYVRRKIRSVLYNLLSNAIKYASSDTIPKIYIKTEKVNEYIVLTVQDNGIGIAEDKHDTVFARYARISDEVEGTGVGLFIVKSMVEDSGGKIEVESALGKGSTFKVYIKE